MNNIKEKIRTILSEQIVPDLAPTDLTDNISLLNDIQLDSIQLLQLISCLERVFDIQFSGEDLVLDLFDTVESIAKLIIEKIGKEDE